MDYLRILSRADLSYVERIVLAYMLHPNYKDQAWRQHAEALRIPVRSFYRGVERLIRGGYLEKISREDDASQWNHNVYRVTERAKSVASGA